MKRMHGLGLVALAIAGLLAAGSAWLGRGWIIDLSTGAADLTVHGHEEEHIGQAVAAGDINGDGFQDLIFRSNDAVYVIYGGPDLAPPGARPVSINLAETPAGMTIVDSDPDVETVADDLATGDVNGDGIADVILGLEILKSDADPGERILLSAHVFWGRRDLPTAIDLHSTPADLTVITEVVGSGPGSYRISVAAGDVNGDGVDDLIVGSPGARWPDIGPGATYIVFGGASLPAVVDLSQQPADFTVYGQDYEWIGKDTAAGDINGDGVGDLIIGVPTAPHADKVYVIYGRSDLTGSLDLSQAPADVTVAHQYLWGTDLGWTVASVTSMATEQTTWW